MIDKVKIASKNWADDYIQKHGNQVTKLLQCAYTEGFIKGVELSERKHGHWIYEGNVYVAKCSVCESYLDMCGICTGGKANFCPYCGAKMDEVTR